MPVDPNHRVSCLLPAVLSRLRTSAASVKGRGVLEMQNAPSIRGNVSSLRGAAVILTKRPRRRPCHRRCRRRPRQREKISSTPLLHPARRGKPVPARAEEVLLFVRDGKCSISCTFPLFFFLLPQNGSSFLFPADAYRCITALISSSERGDPRRNTWTSFAIGCCCVK